LLWYETAKNRSGNCRVLFEHETQEASGAKFNSCGKAFRIVGVQPNAEIGFTASGLNRGMFRDVLGDLTCQQIYSIRGRPGSAQIVKLRVVHEGQLDVLAPGGDQRPDCMQKSRIGTLRSLIRRRFR